MILWPCLMVLLEICSLSTAASLKTGEDSPSDNTPVVSAVNMTHPATNQTDMTSNQTSSYNKSAETLEVRDMPTEEGDMIMLEDRNAANSLWSSAIVPYEISPTLGHRAAEIQAAFQMISSTTCIRFVVHEKELNYIDIKDGEGCASFVGEIGGSQPVFFSSSCSVGNLAHELIHALGLYHEHTRNDRDSFVTINWSNIMPGKTENFDVKHGNTLNQPYDYESIMHYGADFFSVNRSPTIVVNKKGQNIGQRTRLSRLDIYKLKTLYSC